MTEPKARARPAGARDLDTLGELYLRAARLFAARDPHYELAMDAGRMWRDHIVDGLKTDRLRVTVTDGENARPVSFLVARVAPSPPGAARPLSGFIEGAFVDEAHRRQGRLRAMNADAMRWFAVKRVPTVELIADLRDDEARAAWRALGFADVQSVMRVTVPPPD